MGMMMDAEAFPNGKLVLHIVGFKGLLAALHISLMFLFEMGPKQEKFFTWWKTALEKPSGVGKELPTRVEGESCYFASKKINHYFSLLCCVRVRGMTAPPVLFLSAAPSLQTARMCWTLLHAPHTLSIVLYIPTRTMTHQLGYWPFPQLLIVILQKKETNNKSKINKNRYNMFSRWIINFLHQIMVPHMPLPHIYIMLFFSTSFIHLFIYLFFRFISLKSFLSLFVLPSCRISFHYRVVTPCALDPCCFLQGSPCPWAFCYSVYSFHCYSVSLSLPSHILYVVLVERRSTFHFPLSFFPLNPGGIRNEKMAEEAGGPVSFVKRMIRYMDGCDLLVDFEGKQKEDMVVVDDFYRSKTTIRLHRFSHDEVVVGSVLLTPQGRSYSHLGLQIELRGVLAAQHSYEDIAEGASAVGASNTGQYDSEASFLCQAQTYEPETIQQPTRFPFKFGGAKPFESYYGNRVQVRYMIYVRINRSLKNISHREYFFVSRIPGGPASASKSQEDGAPTQPEKKNDTEQCSALVPSSPNRLQRLLLSNILPPPEKNRRCIEMGVQSMLQIEFSFFPTTCHLEGEIMGSILFRKVDCKPVSGELGLVRQETVAPITLFEDEIDTSVRRRSAGINDSETLQLFEVFDGVPRAGDLIPIRLLLSCVPRVTPTYENIHGNRAAVRYFLSLTLSMADGKRYVKQEELHILRRPGQEAKNTEKLDLPLVLRASVPSDSPKWVQPLFSSETHAFSSTSLCCSHKSGNILFAFSFLPLLYFLLDWCSTAENSSNRIITVCRYVISALVLVVSVLQVMRRSKRRQLERNAVTLVTGGGSGIGMALAVEFSKAKNKLVLVGRNAEALERAATACRDAGAVQVDIVVADLMTQEGTSHVVNEVQRLHKDKLKYLVLNAGAGAIIPFGEGEKFEQVCRDVMEINYFSNVRLLMGLLPVLNMNHTPLSPSRIIGMSSLAGVLPSILRTPYTASKHAFQGFMNALRGETPVPITLCCPGYVDTDFHQRAALSSVEGGAPHNARRGIPASVCAQKCVAGALVSQPEVIFTLSGNLGYKLRPFFTNVVDRMAKKKSLDSLRH
eukprot:gene8206-5731_t